MADPEIDDVTLRLAARGDRRACQRFVERYQALVFATAARVVGRDAVDLPDLAQEAFLRAFGALAGFDPAGSARVATWLATIATRVALDAVRRRRTLVPLDAVQDAPDTSARSPDEALDEARRRARLARAMEALDPDQRAAIVLRVEHDLPYADVARALGVEVGTVKSRLARARQALAAAVGDGADDRAGNRTKDQHV